MDEIFKVRHRSAGNAGNAPEVAAQANSSILNSLLTLLNERAYDNGSSRCPVPLLCLIGASNELPESEELDALYDRFMIRKCGMRWKLFERPTRRLFMRRREVTQVSDAGLRTLLSAPVTVAAKRGAPTGGELFTPASLQTARAACSAESANDPG